MLDTKRISFQETCKKLREEYNPKEYVWASYGAYDLNMLKKQCKFRDVEYPMSQEHINVKELFTKVKGLTKKTGMNGALHILKIPLEGTHHRGVDDAKNITKILDWCLKNEVN